MKTLSPQLRKRLGLDYKKERGTTGDRRFNLTNLGLNLETIEECTPDTRGLRAEPFDGKAPYCSRKGCKHASNCPHYVLYAEVA